jgi:arabinogalactan endo-1,4-beta-galactosidase
MTRQHTHSLAGSKSAAVVAAVLAVSLGTAGAAEITFRVDMSTQAGYGLFLPGSDAVVARGTFNGWSGDAEMLSDGDGDLVYELALELANGAYEYKYVVVPAAGADRWEDSIDNRLLEVSGDDTLDVVWFDDDMTVPVPPQDTEVLFSVDMSLESSWGRFYPEQDLVTVRGGHDALGGWSDAGATLERRGSSAVYEAWIEFEDLSNYPVPHKFVVLREGDPGSSEWEDHIEDRTFRITGDEVDEQPPGGNGYAERELPLAVFDHGPGWLPGDRVLGADLSHAPRLLSLGAEYRVDGTPADPLDIFADHGFGLVRLRLWHTPAEPWHGLSATVAYAAEARAAGHELMLDLHYSDTWADPGHQTKPAAWEGLSFPSLVDSVYAYTNAVIRRFRDEDALPDYVQIGNEISGGLLWNDGRVGGAWDTPQQWAQLGELLDAGVAAVRDSLPEEQWPEIVIHVDNGCSIGLCRWFFDGLDGEGVDFDVVGVSYYTWWHGHMADLRGNLHDLATRYSKPVMVVETSYAWTLEGYDDTGNFVDSVDDLHPGFDATPEGQLAFLRELLAVVEGVPEGLGAGVVYWEPAYLAVPGGPANPHENLTLFDFDGDALPALGFSIPWGTSVPGGNGEPEEGHGAVPTVAPARPNPFGSRTSLACEVPSGGARVSAKVFDTAGRLVAVLADNYMDGGCHTLDWDGRDRSGQAVASGVYFLLVEAPEHSELGKVVLLR